jgi:hypothetical protein
MGEQKKPHSWTKKKWSQRQFCQKCGLLALRNEATEKKINQSCAGDFYVNIHDPTAMKFKKEMR